MSIKVKISYKLTRSKSYASEIKIFKDVEEYNKWILKGEDESYRKIIGLEAIE